MDFFNVPKWLNLVFVVFFWIAKILLILIFAIILVLLYYIRHDLVGLIKEFPLTVYGYLNPPEKISYAHPGLPAPVLRGSLAGIKMEFPTGLEPYTITPYVYYKDNIFSNYWSQIQRQQGVSLEQIFPRDDGTGYNFLWKNMNINYSILPDPFNDMASPIPMYKIYNPDSESEIESLNFYMRLNDGHVNTTEDDFWNAITESRYYPANRRWIPINIKFHEFELGKVNLKSFYETELNKSRKSLGEFTPIADYFNLKRERNFYYEVFINFDGSLIDPFANNIFMHNEDYSSVFICITYKNTNNIEQSQTCIYYFIIPEHNYIVSAYLRTGEEVSHWETYQGWIVEYLKNHEIQH